MLGSAAVRQAPLLQKRPGLGDIKPVRAALERHLAGVRGYEPNRHQVGAPASCGTTATCRSALAPRMDRLSRRHVDGRRTNRPSSPRPGLDIHRSIYSVLFGVCRYSLPKVPTSA
jgi:hypothetical protein